jgi:hypothetical protein
MKRDSLLPLIRFKWLLSLPAGKIDTILILTPLLPLWYYAIGMACNSLLKRKNTFVVICFLVFLASILCLTLFSMNSTISAVSVLSTLISIYALIIIDAILLNRIRTLKNDKTTATARLIILIIQLSISFIGFFRSKKR